MFTVASMKMRWCMIIPEHLNDNPIKRDVKNYYPDCGWFLSRQHIVHRRSPNMKKTLKWIAPLKAGKVGAAVYAMASIVFSPLIALCVLYGPDSRTGIGWAFVILFAIIVIYAIAGFLTGVVGGWLYNLAAKAMEGIQIELED